MYLFLLGASPAARANDIYIAQNSSGSGSSCGSALPVSWFNQSSSWGGGNSQIGPDSTVHLCGTITSQLQIQGNGTAGHEIEILWEQGAKLSQPANSLINLNGHSHLVFDGGTPCGPGTACSTTDSGTGIIEATNNGSPPLGNQSNSVMAFVGSGGFIEIRNLVIRNLYKHTSVSDTTSGADSGILVIKCYTCTGDLSIHDSTIHDTGNTISLEFFSNSPSVRIYNNYFYNYNWAIENSGNGVRTVYIHDNHFGSTTNWDTTSDTYHHNAVHDYMNVPSDSLGIYIYNNLADGDVGTCCATSTLLFSDGDHPNNLNVFNNVAVQSCKANRAPAIRFTASYGTLVNNTMIGCSTTAANVEAFELSGSNIDFRNNAIQGWGQYLVTHSGTTFTHIDNNAYGTPGLSGNSPWQWGSTGAGTLAQWQSASKGDARAITGTLSLQSIAPFKPTSGSPLVGSAANLSGLSVSGLSVDINGTVRPGSGNWDAGAAQFSSSSSGSAPNPPSGLAATVN